MKQLLVYKQISNIKKLIDKKLYEICFIAKKYTKLKKYLKNLKFLIQVAWESKNPLNKKQNSSAIKRTKIFYQNLDALSRILQATNNVAVPIVVVAMTKTSWVTGYMIPLRPYSMVDAPDSHRLWRAELPARSSPEVQIRLYTAGTWKKYKQKFEFLFKVILKTLTAELKHVSYLKEALNLC